MVGVGPGDPELITVAAQRAIAAATVVAYPVAALERPGMAAQIAQPWLVPSQRRLPLLFPMVQEAEPRQQAWQQAARAVAAEVAAGEQVVFLCEGDCSLFASSSYLLLALKKEAPELLARVIPGITAASATAAAACWPLALQDEQLQVVPLPDQPDQARQLLIAARDQGQPLVLLKVGRRWRWLRP
ncbi:MAG: precorrin-2 C(20)-methyltransferase, partial [Synechococcus sp.]|nr:precorrin-2 C(20)-methyltransferase [Synechococcus sp.]